MSKMFAIVFVSNIGFGAWSIVLLVAILQLPEDFIIRYGDRFSHSIMADFGFRHVPSVQDLRIPVTFRHLSAKVSMHA